VTVPGRPVRVRAATIDASGESVGQVPAVRRHVSIGPVAVSDITFLADLTVGCEDVGSGHYVHLPVSGTLQSRHRGTDLTATRELAAVYQPGAGSFRGQWAAGTRVLCVRLDQAAVRAAMAALPGGGPGAGTGFGLALNTRQGYGRAWAGLLLSLSRQPAGPDRLLAQHDGPQRGRRRRRCCRDR
jgi:hypothetical protein